MNIDKQLALLEEQIRELEDELMNMCFQRNIAESKVTQMIERFKMFKQQGLIDDECDLMENVI
jgi:ribosomal protein L29